jgi:hypothetical protein
MLLQLQLNVQLVCSSRRLPSPVAAASAASPQRLWGLQLPPKHSLRSPHSPHPHQQLQLHASCKQKVQLLMPLLYHQPVLLALLV